MRSGWMRGSPGRSRPSSTGTRAFTPVFDGLCPRIARRELMAAPKILVIPGSLRSSSHNARLAALATKELMLADADVTRISLADYPLPLYDADLTAKSGPPFNAFKLKQLIS